MIASNDYLLRKAFRSYLLVSILVTMSSTLGITVDSIVAGNLIGPHALAVLSLVAPIATTLTAVSGILTGGAVALCNVLIGRGERQKVNPVFSAVMLIALVFTGLCSLVCYFARVPIAAALGANSDLLGPAADYLKGFSPGFIPLVMSFQLLSFTKIDGSQRLGMIGIFAMTAVNIVLDYLFAGPLGMGMFGLALATSISYCVAVLVCLLHFLKKTNTLRLVSIRGAGRDIGQLLVLGVPNALNRLMVTFRTLVLNRLLLFAGGVAALTALGAHTTVGAVVGAVPMGVGQAIAFIVGLFYGEEDLHALRKTLVIALRLGIVLTLVLAAALLVASPAVAGLLGIEEQAALRQTVTALCALAASLPFMLVCNTLVSYYMSTQNSKMANFICIAHNFVLVILPALALMPLLGTLGIWIAFVIAEILTILAVYAIGWRRQKKISFSVDTLLMLPQSFGKDIEEAMEFSVGNAMESVAEASAEVQAFCLRNGISRQSSYTMALSVEEMAGNVIRHGFTPGKKQFLDIRILKTSSKLIYRMRDDGKPFSPLQYEAPPGPESGLGIRMVKQLAVAIDYQNTLSMNNLIVQIE